MSRRLGRITYIATQDTPARSPYHAAAFYLLPIPYAREIDSGGLVDIFLDWGYRSTEPSYKDDRTFAESSSGIIEVRHFHSAINQKMQIHEVDEAYNTEYVQNGTFDADALWAKGGPEWSIGGGAAACDGTQAGTSDLTNAGEVVAGTVEVKATFSGITAGTITPIIGGVVGTARSADGTYTEEIIATGTSIVFRADASFVGSIDNVSVKTINVVSDYAAMNALNDEIAKGTVMTWWPDYENRPSDFFSIIGNKRIAPKRKGPEPKWTYTFDYRIAPAVQFPSTIPPFEAA
jgi:hypothetical protein